MRVQLGIFSASAIQRLRPLRTAPLPPLSFLIILLALVSAAPAYATHIVVANPTSLSVTNSGLVSWTSSTTTNAIDTISIPSRAWDSDGAFPVTGVLRIASGTTQYQIPDLNPDLDYEIRLRATVDSGGHGHTSFFYAAPAYILHGIGPPANGTFASSGANPGRVTWDAVGGALEYEARHRSRARGSADWPSSWQQVETISSEFVREYDISGFNSRRDYQVEIRSLQASGQTRSNPLVLVHVASRPTSVPSNAGESGGDKTEMEATPSIATCRHLPASIRVWARFGLDSGLQCQQVGALGVGIQSVIDAGLINAVDIWSYVSQGAAACIAGSGILVFLDATTAPKAISLIESFQIDGMTCTRINRPGTLALLSSPPRGVMGPTASPAPDFNQSMAKATPDAMTALQNCMVTTNDTLNFRDAPGGDLIRNFPSPQGNPVDGWIPKNATLTALTRTTDWFLVDYHGTQGWISAGHVTPRGACG